MRAKKWGRTILYKYELASDRHEETVEHAIRLLGIEARQIRRNRKSMIALTLYGEELHELMKQLWDYLPKHRQHEYAVVKRTSDASVSGVYRG